MEFFEELEIMALNATERDVDKPEEEPPESYIMQWQQLFSYSYLDAANLIKQHRADLSRRRISDEHWQLVRSEKERQGYDKEAYEHELETRTKRLADHPVEKIKDKNTSTAQLQSFYNVKLEVPLDTPEKIKVAGGMNKLPEVLRGIGHDGDAAFCYLDGNSKNAILQWLSTQHIAFQPTFARITRSEKELLQRLLTSYVGS